MLPARCRRSTVQRATGGRVSTKTGSTAVQKASLLSELQTLALPVALVPEDVEEDDHNTCGADDRR